MPGTFGGSVAFASISFAAPGVPTFRTQSGDFASVAMSGAAVRLTFQQGLAASESTASIGLRSSSGGTAYVREWTASYLEVETLNLAGASAELDFDLVLLQQTTGLPVVVPPTPPTPPPTPPPAENLIAHWDASTLTGIEDGATFNLWPDISGTGNDLNQNGGFGGVDPVYVASEPLFGGQPAATFNGTQWILHSGAPLGMPEGNPAVTIYTVAYSTIAGRPIWYWGTSYPFENTGHAIGLSTSASPEDSVAVFNNNSGWGALAVPTGVPFVAAWAHTAGDNVIQSPLYINGETGPSLVPGIPSPLDMTPTINWTISFALPGGSYSTQSFAGAIAEVLVYNATHTPETIASVSAYLQNKWGIP